MDEERSSPQTRIGWSLRRAREERGLSLREAEEATKVRARYLRDLEREDFDVLPSVYVLGSLKTYADYLGLDGKALAGELRRRQAPQEEQSDPSHGGSPDSPVDAASPPAVSEDEYEDVPLLAAGFDRLLLGFGVLLILVLALMTIVPVLAREEQPTVSEVREPSVYDAPNEVALAGNVAEDPARQTPREQSPPKAEENKDDSSDDRAESSNDEKDETGQSFLDPSFPTQSSTGAASASASPAPVASVSASAAPDPAFGPPAAGNTETSPSAPFDEAPDGAPAPSTATVAPSGGGSFPGRPSGGRLEGPVVATSAGRISAEIDRRIDEAFEGRGIGR